MLKLLHTLKCLHSFPSRAAMMRLLVLATCASTVACVWRGPQVLTPVRVPSVPPPPIETQPTASRPIASVADDPFHRIDRMDWPGPNELRLASGAPGPDYWQQRADYNIAATLDTAARIIRGTVSIRYTNNSPDTLRFVWVQLDQNLYRSDSKGAALFPAESRWGVRGFQGGYSLTGIQVNGRGVAGRIDDTMMRLDLETPLAPHGASVEIGMQYSFAVPEHGSDRMGRDSALYEIAQWFPRMAVYDDVRGWNPDPYLGQGEFYLEYGTIDYAVTVPAGYVVAGSGVLQNRAEVLTPAQLERLDRAARGTSVVQIVTADEALAAKRRIVSGTRTWRFHADRVRDAAWAAAPDFRWDATSWDGVLTQALYEFPKSGRAWEAAAEQTQWSIRMYSSLWFHYPYPQATSVAGPVGGMEYPMFVMVHYGSDDPASIFSTIDHEQGHEWFPMVIGSNERRYAWMDEGINTYQNAFSNERRVPGTNTFAGYVGNWKQAVDDGTQSPLMTPPDRIDAAALGAIGYRKPGAVLLALRDNVIGRDAMDRAMREYANRWAFKHPTPADFFRTVENVSGQDLSWFWNAFFYGTDVLDIAIDGVSTRQANGRTTALVSLRRATSIPFPVTMRLRFNDKSTRDVRLPVEIWARGNRYTAEIPIDRAITGVRLWPDATVPDWNQSNDVWGDPPPADPPAASTAGGLMPAIPSSPSRK
jgi:Peptidase family M1 domain